MCWSQSHCASNGSQRGVPRRHGPLTNLVMESLYWATWRPYHRELNQVLSGQDTCMTSSALRNWIRMSRSSQDTKTQPTAPGYNRRSTSLRDTLELARCKCGLTYSEQSCRYPCQNNPIAPTSLGFFKDSGHGTSPSLTARREEDRPRRGGCGPAITAKRSPQHYVHGLKANTRRAQIITSKSTAWPRPETHSQIGREGAG